MTIQDQRDVVTKATEQALAESQKDNWQIACYHLSVALRSSTEIIVILKKVLDRAVREPHEN